MRIHRRINWDLWLGGAVMVALALLIIYCYVQSEARVINESVTVVPSDRVGPQMEQALKSLSDAWREENRNRR